MKEKIVEIFSDPEFAKKSLEMMPEELQVELEKKGVSVSIDELKETAAVLTKLLSSSEELDIQTLDTVVGGGKFGDFCAGAVIGFFAGCGAFAAGCLIGLGVIAW